MRTRLIRDSLGPGNLPAMRPVPRELFVSRSVAAFSGIGDATGLVVLEEPVVVYHCDQILAFLRERRLPAVAESRNFVDGGALASYGPDRLAIFAP